MQIPASTSRNLLLLTDRVKGLAEKQSDIDIFVDSGLKGLLALAGLR